MRSPWPREPNQALQLACPHPLPFKPTTSSPVTRSPTSPPLQFGVAKGPDCAWQAESLGCLAVRDPAQPPKKLSPRTPDLLFNSPALTTQLCRRVAAGQGYIFYWTSAGTKCYGARSRPPAKKAAGQCTTPCGDDAEAMCGGQGGAASLYKIAAAH